MGFRRISRANVVWSRLPADMPDMRKLPWIKWIVGRMVTAVEADRSSDYFSLRQLTEPRFSTVLDSISTSKPFRSRYFSVSTWPLPISETP